MGRLVEIDINKLFEDDYEGQVFCGQNYNSLFWERMGVCGISGKNHWAIDDLCWDGVFGKPDRSAYEYGYRGDLFDQLDYYSDRGASFMDYFIEDSECSDE